jgi:DNA-binding PadR family transcriptional regulator
VALIRGTLDVLVLKTLSWTPMHAFEIIAWLNERSDGQLDLEGPAIIQALHRMEERKLVAGEWGTTKNGRRARYYRMTADGRAYLRAESAKLAADTGTLLTILGAKRG